ncbi:recombinase family protein [Streptomyces sp. NPDC057509]|uniref:recombinase family protein n=1 Tax=Streptomyces sp. NPDC057509 TaxID=3346152 RepID=UPI00367CB3EF
MERNRASLYVRLSVKAGETNASLEGMIKELRELCVREGLHEVALHVDNGLSGGFRDRKEFQEWLEDAKQQRADVLVTFHVDRLTREGLNVAASLLDVVEGKDPASGRRAHHPVRLLDARGIDSAHGDSFRFRFVLQAEVARSERERMRDRSRSSVRRLRRAHRWPGGSVPFGYRAVPNPNGPGQVLDIAPDEAAILRDAAEWVLAGDSATRVCRRLNHEGRKPRRAREWVRQTLTRALCGDAVLGRITVNGALLLDDKGRIATPYPPVLTVAQSAALRAVLAPDPNRQPSAGRHPARLLSGLLYCHGCPQRLLVARRSGGAVYRCPTGSQGGVCEGGVSIAAEKLEAYVRAEYLQVAGHLRYFREEVQVSNAEELSMVEADIAHAVRELSQNATADGFATLQRLQALRTSLTSTAPERLVSLVDTGKTIAEVFATAMLDDQRDMLADAFDEIVILPGRRGPKTLDPERVLLRWAPEEVTDQAAD